MKKIFSFFLMLCLLVSVLVSVTAEGTSATVTEIQKYGNLVLSVPGSELMSRGYAYGDVVTVMGEGGPSADELASWMGTINYEIVCMFANRLPRIYVE